ncbi:MAG: AAA family ATPase [Prevotella sp.]|nr:AAA family ATPase [Prevotella sp.]
MRIVIHNFGPIKEADIETKRYTVFIGQTSTGKSVAAKLISIANDYNFMMLEEGDFKGFTSFLSQYSIDFPFHDDTEICIYRKKALWTIRKDILKIEGERDTELMTEDAIEQLYGKEHDWDSLTDFQKKMIYQTSKQSYASNTNPVYIPAERILLSIFTNSIFSLLSKDMPIPESIKRFGTLYGVAKDRNKDVAIDFMNISVRFSKEQDTIHIDNEDVDIDFSQASSGMQSIIPMWIVFCDSLYGFGRHIIIEEPELNLFPTLQVQLVHKMAERINSAPANLVITTHSPYILSVFDNLIYAKDVYDRVDDIHQKKVASLVNPDAMISFDDVAAYSFDENGIVTYINDAETRSTGAYALDAASTETANVFNELLAIDNEL